jgi:hypothetical protein
MEPDLPDMDEADLRKVARIERALGKLDRDDNGAFMSITNALEFHLENYPRDPETVRLLARALEAFVKSRGIEPRAAGFAKPLEDLLRYEA